MILFKGNNKRLLLLACFCSSVAFAASQPSDPNYPVNPLQNRPYGSATLIPANLLWMVTLSGGYANLSNSGNSQSFTGTDDDAFTYNNQGNGKSTGFIGAFIGAEWRL